MLLIPRNAKMNNVDALKKVSVQNKSKRQSSHLGHVKEKVSLEHKVDNWHS
uniref:Uncharacterized protein n=1 Tax=Arion vulgaris TaxID=1028688 RepID=A0A0B7BWN7_9EUPU